ncbi:MAG: hypothetical protein HGA39_08200 [Coriobacteriia bacterium]|nr:hypothetical protein [Coriobacteriia bacterium]
MTVVGTPLRRRTAVWTAAVSLVIAFSAVGLLAAVAATPPATTPPTASLDSPRGPLPVNSTAKYTVTVTLPKAVDELQVKLQLNKPSGAAVYSRTQVIQNAATGTRSFSFSPDTATLKLTPGVYPVQVTVKSTVNGSTSTTSVATELLLYDAAKSPVPVALVFRVHGAPFADPSGKLVADPAENTRARDDVDAIVRFATENPKAKISMAVPPVLLQQWRQLAQGYTLPNGKAVLASEATPRAYANTLSSLKAALGSGALELTSLGYADPDLGDLALQGLGSDTALQYTTGYSAILASLGATPSAGTAPANGAAPSKVLQQLADIGLRYVVVDSALTALDSKPASSGAYPTAISGLAALVADHEAGVGLSAGEASATVRHAFERMLVSGTTQPFTVCVDLGDGGVGASAVLEQITGTLLQMPWANLVLARDAAARTGSTQLLTMLDTTNSGAVSFWQTVNSASAYAAGLRSSLQPGDADIVAATTPSLLAESSAWKGLKGDWTLADRGAAFASTSLGISKGILGTIYLKGEPITLAGTSGNVPITIGNGTQKTLSVTVKTRALTEGLTVAQAESIETTLPPKETFVQVPVNLMSTASGKLEVQVLAGDLVVSSQIIDVHASYLDRIAIIGAIVIGLGVLLGYIVRRVRSADDSSSSAAPDDAEDAAER